MIMTRENSGVIAKEEIMRYRVYSIKIIKCEEMIDKYENDAMNIKSPRTDRIGENTSVFQFDLLGILNLIETEKIKIEAFSEMQSWILEVVNGMANKSLRPDIIRLYLRGEPRKKVAFDRGVSYNHLSDQIQNEFNKGLSDELITEYNRIKRKANQFEP